ncbi:MAG: hypothetical protein CMB53_02940 [Euryarchaeota archaeon]|nr:hypothetical protein [Euryarchaeota archaeon]|tara:strand:- start:5785 stop:6543 length:759 start_codon:yes stop_codon:yes gene_type:complete
MKERPTDLTPVNNRLVPMQDEIRSHFGWNLEKDEDSANDLLATVESTDIESWSRFQRASTVAGILRRVVLREQEIAILGAAIEVDELLPILDEPTLLVAADGATGVFSLLPETTSERAWSRLAFLVSDADGGEGTIAAVKRGIPVFLHAHGDNQEDWRKLLEIAASSPTPPPLVLTHQTPNNIEGMHNPGGFTDGDRAACITRSLGVPVERIRMLGTRTDVVGRWSGDTDPQQKIVKLGWMERVLRNLEIDF